MIWSTHHAQRKENCTHNNNRNNNSNMRMRSQSCCWLLPLAFGKYKSNRSKSTELPVSNRYTRTRDSINSFSPAGCGCCCCSTRARSRRVACMLHVGDFWLQIMQPPPGQSNKQRERQHSIIICFSCPIPN